MMGLIDSILPWVIAGAFAIAAFFGHGKMQRKAGRGEVLTEIEKADAEGALGIREKLDAVATDGDAIGRLRKAGRLRD